MMPLYIPWLTETIKKRGVRYLLHHYLGQFFEEKLTLEQLSIDIYEGKGSIRNLALDVDGLNDELDFIPFKFMEGCSIGQISVEVPWSSLATDACRVELEGAKFVCRLKTLTDGTKAHCTESTLLTRSLMTTSMQMAEDIVTTEDDDEYDSPSSSVYRHHQNSDSSSSKKKDANQMFEGLEMFAQLIDSVLRRTKLTARDTLFQIQPNRGCQQEEEESGDRTPSPANNMSTNSQFEGDFNETSSPKSMSDSDSRDRSQTSSEGTVEFFIRFFRCEEIINQTSGDMENQPAESLDSGDDLKRPISAMPETVTKMLTLEDVEMRIGGLPVSNLIGKHTIMIKFNGQKSEISIFSGSPLLAVIGHEQLKTFFNVFDSSCDHDKESSPSCEKNQKVMSMEDYAKIENQLLESASMRNAHNQVHMNDLNFVGSSHGTAQIGRRWIDGGELYSNMSRSKDGNQDYNYHLPFTSQGSEGKLPEAEPSLDNIEAFSCELKLPGIWLCILRDGEAPPPLIKPYADSINSFQTINKYIEARIKVPHIRFLALKVALDITTSGINVFLGDLDISEHLQDDSIYPTLHLLRNDFISAPLDSPRYKASIVNNKELTVELLTKTRLIFDPTMIDRIVYDYKLINLSGQKHKADSISKQRNQLDLNLTIRGEQFKVELLCPIPDLTPEAQTKLTQLRPQSFLFDFKDIVLTWQSDKLNLSAKELLAYVKTQPKQSDSEAVKFIQSTSKNSDKIVLILEPSPSNLDTAFPNEVNQALNESSMYDSIYVGQATESKLPSDAFQTKRKVVRASTQNQSAKESGNVNDYDNEKIITPGDRQHLLDYLNQTVMSTKLSLSINLPVCEVEFEDKEQLDLIYNRFGNDFVFWQPKALTNTKSDPRQGVGEGDSSDEAPLFRQPSETYSPEASDQESEVSYHSLSIDGSVSDYYTNEVTCKIQVDELLVRFNHQSCAAAMKQEISAENLLLGVVIDVNKKPGTVLSLVADNLELSTDSEIVLEGNSYGDKNSTFFLTAEIKRPTKSLKDIKLAIQLVNGLFNDFKSETYMRFWQSINVTDEPIAGYLAPTIVTELHIDILNTALSLVKEGARPALISVDELYLTSMVMEQTSQVMIRLIADEVSMYLKRNKQGLETMKSYVCLVDSGLIDLDIKFSQLGQLEFGVINNVITVRACQDSLSALFGLFSVIMNKSSESAIKTNDSAPDNTCQPTSDGSLDIKDTHSITDEEPAVVNDDWKFKQTQTKGAKEVPNAREMDLLEDAMNDFSETSLEDSSSVGQKLSDDEGDEIDDADDDEDSDEPPMIQTTSEHQRDPNACLLDESNPLIGDFFSPPLLPSPGRGNGGGSGPNKQLSDSFSSTSRSINESGFFVIGDDDVGAGIMDKTQREPVVRKLVDRPINIIENHFKMTKPRTIPEMLLSSLERYVLEEMTLVVNLYGGRDFDEENSGEDTVSTNAASEADQDSAETLETASMGSGSARSRAGSVASVKKSSLTSTSTTANAAAAAPSATTMTGKTSSGRKQGHSESSGSLLMKKGSVGGAGGRRKNLSEGSKNFNHRGNSAPNSSAERSVRFGEGAVNLWESLDLISSPDFLSNRRPSQAPLSAESKVAGGTWRQTDVCIQLTLTKVKLLYEIADQSSPISWRFMLFIHDIEIKDRIHASDINKMLYEYCTESMPKRNIQMLTIKNVATINPSDGCEECDLRVSLKPLRLNIDQDTLLFLIEFFTAFSKSISKQQASAAAARSSSASSSSSSSSTLFKVVDPRAKDLAAQACSLGAKDSSPSQLKQRVQQQQSSQGIEIRKRQSSERSDTTSHSFGSSASSSSSAAPNAQRPGSSSSLSAPTSNPRRTTGGSARGDVLAAATTTTLDVKEPTTGDSKVSLPTHCHKDKPTGAGGQQPIYIKSFIFSPDVPIRVDYHAKHLDFEQGALAGILMGLAHLDHSELVLRRVQAKHGMRGLDRVLLFTLNSWMSDIKRNQLPSILSGIGPMHSVIQLFQGMRDLIWMPIDHYRKDRRLVRGLQRGASSFSSSTAMAAINLMNRFISIVQCTAQIAHDIVTPPAFQSSSSRRDGATYYKSGALLGASSSSSSSLAHASHHHHRHHNGTCAAASPASNSSIVALNQPRNFCEGVAVGFTILKEGFNDTARNVAVGMQADDVRCAVGELVRQIPSTLLNPIISATEGAQNVLVGIRNQIAPDARREDQEKWKRRVRGK